MDEIIIGLDTTGDALEERVKKGLFSRKVRMSSQERALLGTARFIDSMENTEFEEKRNAVVKIYGKEKELREAIERFGLDILTKEVDGKRRAEIVDCDQYLDMGEERVEKSSVGKSSLYRALEDHKKGTVDCVFSAGNTKYSVIFAKEVLGMLKFGRYGMRHSLEFPPIIVPLPTLKGKYCLLVDAGANIAPGAQEMLDYAIMASIYHEKMFEKRAKIGILSNGTESTKGTNFLRKVKAKMGEIDYLKERMFKKGYVEPYHVFNGNVDVVITDGFTGNICLKTAEAAASYMRGSIEQAINESNIFMKAMAMAGYMLMKYPVFDKIKKSTDPSNQGGAPLLGIEGYVLVGHGKTSINGFAKALEAAEKERRAGVNDEIVHFYTEKHKLGAMSLPMVASSMTFGIDKKQHPL